MTLARAGRPARRVAVAALALPLALGLLAFALALSVAVGAADLSLGTVVRTVLRPDDSTESLIVHSLRLPRAVIAALAGACLGVSGAVLQGVTRNPLASPGIVGVNAGAALAILVAVVFAPALPPSLFVPLAFLGGVGAAALVYAVTAAVGLTPLRLALAGVAVGALLAALSSAITLLFEERARAALFSLAGSVANRTWEHVAVAGPWAAVALLAALPSSGLVNLLALGEDVATGLGVRLGLARLWLTALAVLLAAAAVSMAGPIGFVGLVAPHLARGLVGPDYRLVVPLSAALGASLLTLADVAARLVDKPLETPVGLLTVAIGAPFFVYLARRIGRAEG